MSDKSLRGTRLGAQSLESDAGVEPAARTIAEYRCGKGHVTRIPFSVEAEVPAAWECKCGSEGLLVDGEKPLAKVTKPVRTHWDMLLERRSVAELEVLLDERLALLRASAQAPVRRRSA
jgi:hypothetical protein